MEPRAALGSAITFASGFGQACFNALFGGQLRVAFGLSHDDFSALAVAGHGVLDRAWTGR
jgi:hypothetical protein